MFSSKKSLFLQCQTKILLQNKKFNKVKKLILLCAMCFMVLAMNAQSFVDLGLPSGTKWKTQNQTGFNTYNEAVSKYGNRLPSKDQWEELEIECSWEWTGSGYKVTGPNGNSITLPAEGDLLCGGSVCNVGSYGSYWSSTPGSSDSAYSLGFDLRGVYMDYGNRCNGASVRLVQN